MKIKNLKCYKIEFIAISLLLLGSILTELMSFLNFFYANELGSIYFSSLTALSVIFITISIIILILNFTVNHSKIIFGPNKILKVLVYNKGGILVYSRSTQETEEGFHITEQFVGGGFAAFSLFFKGTLGSNVSLKYINASKYEFLFSQFPKDSGTIVILVSRANFYLKKSIDKISKTISKEIYENMDRQGGLSDKVEKLIDKLLLDRFPSISFKKNV